MAISVQISCINKTPRFDPHLRISHVGGANQDGTRWKMSEDAAISAIDQGKYNFYVSQDGRSVWVVVATHNGRRYLKTENDGLQPDNLLSLPECPP